MTHDELLARIDAAIDKRKRIYGTIGTRSPEIPRVLTDYHNTGISFLLALRAVVELHKPSITKYISNFIGCDNRSSTNGFVPYPCLTVQAIEKALGVRE